MIFLDVIFGIWRGLYAVFAPVGYFLKDGLRAMAGLDEKRPAAAVAPVARTPRDPRQGLDPADPANAHLLGTCPVCGMDDPERFELGVATDTWNGWPAHETCVTWLGGDHAEDGPVLEPPSWRVTPGPGLSVLVTAERAGDQRRALMLLNPADAVHARTDLICCEYPASGPLSVIQGEPALPAYAPAVPPGAQVVAWVGIPRACNQVYPAMIRCALPSELPGLR